MKVQNVFFERILCVTILYLWSQILPGQCFILNLNVSGPTSCVQKSTPITYTASHIGSSGCTFYEWSVSGGSIIFNGVNVGSSLCVTEALACTGKATCSLNGVGPIGSGMSIQVVWNQVVTNGTITVKVKESGSITLSCTQTLSVTWPSITDITQTSFTCNSATYSATISGSCSGTSVQWFLPGSSSPVATGNPATINLSSLSVGTFILRARAASLGGSSTDYQEQFTNPRPIAITGPSSVNEGTTASFSINGGVNLSNISWTPPFGLGTVIWNGGTVADIKFNNVSFNQSGTITANGQSSVCGSWSLFKSVTVINTGLRSGEETSFIPQINLEQKNVMETSSINIYPTVLSKSQIDFLTIDFDKITNYEIILIDLNGKVLKRRTEKDSQLRVDVSQLASGMYIVSVKTLNDIKSTKIVIQN